jgi:hypothetical protein
METGSDLQSELLANLRLLLIGVGLAADGGRCRGLFRATQRGRLFCAGTG